MGLKAITSCLDVTDEHLRDALAAARSLADASPRERCVALLTRMAEVAKPDAGAPRMLLLLAQMAKRDWIDGDLVVRLIGDHELAVLELMVDDGTSRERIVGPLRIDVPLGELATAFEQDKSRLRPLRAIEATPGRLVLKGTRDARSEGRKASISAFSPEFAQQIGKLAPGAPAPGAPVPGAAASPKRPPPLPKRPPPPPRTGSVGKAPPRRESTASFEKLPAVLEMPDDVDEPEDGER